MTSGEYSNLGARGKNFKKLMSEKKKKSDLGLHIFLQKSGCSLKKKGLHSESFSEQTSAADSKLYVLFSRGDLRQLSHSPYPISTTGYDIAFL